MVIHNYINLCLLLCEGSVKERVFGNHAVNGYRSRQGFRAFPLLGRSPKTSVSLDGRVSQPDASQFTVEKNKPEGNTGVEDVSLPNSVSSHAVQKKKTSQNIYRLALAVCATSKELDAFNDYKKAIRDAGWSLMTTQASPLESAAYIVSSSKQEGELFAAALVVKSILSGVFGGSVRG